MYIALGAAYRIEALGLSIGAAGNLVFSQIDSLRARNIDGTDDLVIPGTTILKEGRSQLIASGWQGAFGLGAIWQPMDNLWVGLSYQSRPNVAGGMELRGTLRNTFGTAPPTESDVTVTQDLPDSVRLGARWRPFPELEVRLFGDWTQWNAYRRQCILDANDENRSCDRVRGGAAGPDASGINAILERRWVNTWGVRAGVSYQLLASLELSGGFGYDSSAIPDATLDPALVDMDKGTLTVGAAYSIFEGLLVHLTFTQVIYADRNLPRGAYLVLEPPSRQPDASGLYRQVVSLFNVAVEYGL